jgi:hypothetical protein
MYFSPMSESNAYQAHASLPVPSYKLTTLSGNLSLQRKSSLMLQKADKRARANHVQILRGIAAGADTA